MSSHHVLDEGGSLSFERGKEQKLPSRDRLLDHQTLEAGQARRLRRARRTAVVVGIIAFVVFVVSIAQMLWLQHHPRAHEQAVKEALMQ